MIKKIAGVFCFILIFCIAAGFYFVKQKDAQVSKQLASVNEQIAPYQSEINELREIINRIRLGTEESEVTAARVIYGFYASSISEIADDGAIVLDAGAADELKNAARATGREIIYFFAPDAPLPQDGAAIVLRPQNDTEENREKISGVVSLFVEDSAAGMIREDLINIPYVYNKSDETSILERILNCKDALLLIFNRESPNNVALLKNYIEYGTLIESTVEETKQYLAEKLLPEEERAARDEEYISELEERIDELQQKIDAIYADSKAKRAAK